MHCRYCGNKLNADAKFCTSCGKGIRSDSNNNTASITPRAHASTSDGAIVRCGNCGYEGPGEKARNIVFVILAWLCVLFAPLITIIYFLATAKWRCPKCQSTFLGVKNKEGKFAGQRSGNGAVIIVIVIVAIVIVGILSSVVLASLNSARMKGRDARRVADVKQLQLALELYYDANQTYPITLDSLSTEYMSEVPSDPAGGSYSYSLCSESSYHLGASLEQETHSALSNDADNVNICVGDNVNGDDSKKCSLSDVGNYCYDVTPWTGDTSTLSGENGDVVQAQDIVVGTGAEATPGTQVSVFYEGTLEDGTVFDSSSAHSNEPLTLVLGDEGIISGFQIGINGMRVGGERIISIPPSLGYGSEAITDDNGTVIIPPNSTLIFNVKLQAVKRI